MTEFEKLSALKAMTGEEREAVLLTYLHIAAEKIFDKLYPFRESRECGEEIPRKYELLQTEIACYLYNKRGAEGETSHSENGIDRTYESASVPDSMLKSVTPFCGVI